MRDPNHLTARADGRFCKKVRGKIHYFGAGGDRDVAVKEWLAVKSDLLAGRVPIAKVAPADQITVREVTNLYIQVVMERRREGKIKPGTYGDYYKACTEFGEFATGGGPLAFRTVDSLTPADFAAVREKWASDLGPWALDRHVQAVRTMFNYAVDVLRIVSRQPWYGDRFGKTTEGQKRAVESEGIRARGERLFTRPEVNAILSGRKVNGVHVPGVAGQLRAMCLLALNGGMNATDCAWLRRDAITKQGKLWVVDFVRGKTEDLGVRWTFPLWPETKKALDDVAAVRPEPKVPEDDALVFLTVFGRPWASETITVSEDDPRIEVGGRENVQVHQAFTRKLVALGIRRDRVAFGAFRHTHVTATSDHADMNARFRVRGHKIDRIDKHYDKLPLPRLKSVTDLARRRLIG